MFFSTSMTEIILLMCLRSSLLVLKFRNIAKSLWLNMGQLFSDYIMLIFRIKKRLVMPLKSSWIKMRILLKKQQMMMQIKLRQNLVLKKLLMNGKTRMRTLIMILKIRLTMENKMRTMIFQITHLKRVKTVILKELRMQNSMEDLLSGKKQEMKK